MRIGIDYTSAAQQGAGIGRLTRNLVRALAGIDGTNQYTLLVQGRESAHPPETPHDRNVASGIPNDNFSEVRTWISERWWTRIWHRLHLPVPVEAVIGSIDAFHSPDFALPPVLGKTRTLVTVHDLSFLHLPWCFDPRLLDYLTENVPRAVRRADWVLADSENTRHDLVEHMGADGDRVTVIYPGVEPRFSPIEDRQALESVRHAYRLPQRFVLSLGTVQPRKNYAGLIVAFGQANLEDVSLVIVGGKGWLYEDTFATVRRLGLEDRVMFAGYVNDADLPAFYNLAEGFALPSLYEGFGIPPLEAMACGIPVITADNSSLPEVVGDAALLVDAEDTDGLADALTRLVSDPALRRDLVARGLVRAARFSWERSARRLLETYTQVCEG